MNTLFERNVRALAAHQPHAATRVQTVERSDRLRRITTRDGHAGLVVVERPSGEKQLHSHYAPYRDAQRIIASSVADAPGTVIVLGVGGGFVTRELLSGENTLSIVAVERSWEVMRTILEWIDLHRELATGRLWFAVTPDELRSVLRGVHIPVLDDTIHVVPLTAWTERPENRPHFRSCAETVKNFLREERADTETIRRFGGRWLVHTVHNSRHMSDTNRYLKTFHRLRSTVRKRRVIVAAAGPSLIPFLVANRSSARRSASKTPVPIIAVDTAYPAFREYGIEPSAVVSLDPQSWGALHVRGGFSEQTILVADAGVGPQVACASVRGSLLWFVGTHPLHQLLFAAHAPVLMLPSAPESVTEAAVLLAGTLAASQIILVGADGGYPRAVTYAAGTYHYAFATRSASRLNPSSNFFSQHVYPHTQSAESSSGDRSHPFFSTAAMENRRCRIDAARNAGKTLSFPPELRRDTFRPARFWESHLNELQRIIERLAAFGAEKRIPADRLLKMLGPHGVAHLPAIAHLQSRTPHSSTEENRTAQILELLDEIRGFLLRENNRYSKLR